MGEKQLTKMSVEELKVRAYDLLVLRNRIQGELNTIQQLIVNRSNQKVEKQKEVK